MKPMLFVVIVDTEFPVTKNTKAKLGVADTHENAYTFRIIANGKYAELCKLARTLNAGEWAIEP
jgi:hypothetical protein